MKKYILLFLLAFQFVLANEPVDAVFKKANDAYNKENYEEALIGFEKIAKDGNVSADLYFNIGNCYYKLGKIAPSIYNYEKALHNFLKAKLHIETVEMSKENIIELLQQRNASEVNISHFIALMNDCEYARYAPATDTAMTNDFDRAIEIITELEKQLK